MEKPLMPNAKEPSYGVKLFIDDDDQYLSFLAQPANRSGYVLNTYRKPNASYIILHRATCRHVQGEPSRGKQWTSGDYLKIWGATIADLTSWTSANLQCVPTPCGACRPAVDKAVPSTLPKTKDELADVQTDLTRGDAVSSAVGAEEDRTVLLPVAKDVVFDPQDNSQAIIEPRMIENEGARFGVIFTSLSAAKNFGQSEEFRRIEVKMEHAINFLIGLMQSQDNMRGIVIDPGSESEQFLSRDAIQATCVSNDAIQTEDILVFGPLSEAVPENLLQVISKELVAQGVAEARAMRFVLINMREIWCIAIPITSRLKLATIWHGITSRLMQAVGPKIPTPDIVLTEISDNSMYYEMGTSLV
jgi:hypothetical protein